MKILKSFGTAIGFDYGWFKALSLMATILWMRLLVAHAQIRWPVRDIRQIEKYISLFLEIILISVKLLKNTSVVWELHKKAYVVA